MDHSYLLGTLWNVLSLEQTSAGSPGQTTSQVGPGRPGWTKDYTLTLLTAAHTQSHGVYCALGEL